MRGPAARLLLIAACFFFPIAHARWHARPAAASCIPKERDALLDFKRGINDPEHRLSSWERTHDCCSWDGVSCSHRTGNVLKLDLSEVNPDYRDYALEGQISPSLLHLEHLEYLDLSWFNQTGSNNNNSLEFLGSMKNLRQLHLTGSLFFGGIPPQLANLSKLEYLDLSLTSFSGKVSPEIGNISTLQHLDLGNMQDIYSLDISWLTHLHSLEYLDMSFVNLSTVVDWIHAFNMIPSLKVLHLAYCGLHGTNQLLGHLNLISIVELDISFNYFHHPVASCWFWNVTTIQSLELSQTYLYGFFPPSLGRLTSLQSLGFADNANAAKMVVDLKYLCELEYLNLSRSLSQGNIKDLVDKLPHGTTTRKISGTGNCSSLYVIDLSNNYLTGYIPSVMSNGHRNEEEVDFYGEWSNRVAEFVLLVVIKCQMLKYGASFFGLVSIDLSENYLTGGIPDQITSLNGLLNLNLSWNQLTGSIPEKIGDMKSVESLDLSRNYLSGEIPQSLSELTYLSYVDLSYNNLTGRIPQGRQLDTLYTENPSMYDGNHGLRGPPLQRNCSSGNISVEKGNQTTSEKDSETIFFYFGLGSGFMVGLWVVFCILLFKKTWRILCYRLFDRAYDRVFVFVVVTRGRLARQATAD
ncbi:hypothetical protein EJB05_27331, partial [Eragrostis curvula]